MSRPVRCARSLRPVLAALLLAGCATAPQAPEDADDAARAERDYARVPPAQPQNCIRVREVRSMEAVGNHSILFYLPNGDAWRNRLRRPCNAIRSNVVFSYDVQSGRLCAGEILNVLDRFGGGLQRMGACALGEFDYLVEEQAQAFEDYQ